MSAINKKEKGFSLVEVLIAMFILSIGMTGIFFLMANNIKQMNNSRDQIVSSMLAQEGVELIRSIYDNNPPADKFLNLANVKNVNYCKIDLLTVASTLAWSVNNVNCDSTYKDNNTGNYYTLYKNSNGIYSHTIANATATRFMRSVVIAGLDNNNVPASGSSATKLRVRVTVSWDNVYRDAEACTLANKCVYVDSYLLK